MAKTGLKMRAHHVLCMLSINIIPLIIQRMGWARRDRSCVIKLYTQPSYLVGFWIRAKDLC